MPEPNPRSAEQLTERLTRTGLFTFEADAHHEIGAFFDLLTTGQGSRLSTTYTEPGRALSYLHAAEFALLPAFMSPGEMDLPPTKPVTVTGSVARLALLKGDCSLIIWTHRTVARFAAADITVFSGMQAN
jgi:hypothetical protein